MGGMHGFGAVVTADGHLTHHEPWEVRAQVLGLVSGTATRGAIEALEPATYLASSYYVRWLLAAESTVLQRGHLDAADLDRWRDAFVTDADVRMPVSSDPAVVAAIRGSGPHHHGTATSHAFGPGDRVRVRRMRPERHHRCPRYLRGVTGEVEKVLGADPVPGLRAAEQAAEPCYTVRFSSVDLFGDRTADGEPPYVLCVDLWERYLEEPA